MRAEIERTESELAAQHGAPPDADAELEAFRSRLREALRSVLSELPGADAAFTARVAAAIDDAVESYRVLVASRSRHEQEARVEQLQRRLHRLRHKLEESELLLARARQAGAQGLPALFDPGRPLAPGDAEYAHKRALLDEVFKLNVELRRLLGAQETATESR